MYKLAIIEDEDFIRDNLSKIVKQNIPDFEVAGLYTDASMIVNEIEEYDVILSDIKMPKMSGLELAERIYTEHKKTKIVLVSAYSDFEYAKKALKYGVFDYLNKPIKISELKKVFEKLKLEIDQKNAYTIAERRTFYSNLAVGNIGGTDIETISKRVEPTLDIHNDSICIYEIVIENYEEYINTTWRYEKDFFYNALYNFFDFDNIFLLRLMLHAKERIIVLAVDKDTGLAEACLLSRIIEAYSILELKMSIFDKTVLPNLSSLLDGNLPINNTIAIRKEQGQLLFSLILEKNIDAAISIAQKIQDKEKVFNEIAKRLQLKLPFIEDISLNQPYNIWITEIITAIVKADTASDTINQIQTYVHDNYQENISLEEIAQKFYFNKAYLGRLFKEKTGESFSDFLIRVRMKKAKELLKDSRYKIYEISALVGYKSAKYFNKVFYAYYGVTPTEYRKRRLSQ